MQIEYLSASRIETYLQCPRKYYYVYECGYDTSSDNTRFGTLVHTVLEDVLTVIPSPTDPLEYSKNKFKELWPQSGILSSDYFTTGYSLLEKFFSTSYYNLWRDKIIDTPEKKFRINLTDEVKVVGFIDLLVQKDEKTLNVIDFKTSVVPKSAKEAETDLQMSIYYLAVKELYPEYENIDLTLFYLRHQPVTTTRSPDFVKAFKDYLIAIYYQIKDDSTMKTVPSPFNCSFCPGKHDCPAFKEELVSDLPETIEELLELYENISAQINNLTSRKKEIAMIIQQYLDRCSTNCLQVADKQVNLIVPKQIKYNTENVLKAVGLENFVRIVDVNKKELEKLLKQDKSLLEKVCEGAELAFGSPYIQINKVRNVAPGN